MPDSQSVTTSLGRRGVLAGGAPIGAVLPPPHRLRAQTPKRGGRFRMGLSGANSTDVLTPGGAVGSMTHSINGGIRSRLIELSPSGALAPELAESWETSDAKTWSFKIRSGVKFHDGRTQTPADVVYALNIHRGADGASAGESVMAAASDVRVDGDRVTVVPNQADVDFPSFLTDDTFVIAAEGATAEGITDGGARPGADTAPRSGHWRC